LKKTIIAIILIVIMVFAFSCNKKAAKAQFHIGIVTGTVS